MNSKIIVLIIIIVVIVAAVAFLLIKKKINKSKKEGKPIYRGYDPIIKDEIENNVNNNIGVTAKAVVEKTIQEEVKEEVKLEIVEEIAPEVANIKSNMSSLSNYEMVSEDETKVKIVAQEAKKVIEPPKYVVPMPEEPVEEVVIKPKKQEIDIPTMEELK